MHISFFIYYCFPWYFSLTSSDSWKPCRSSWKQHSVCLWASAFPQNYENIRFISVYMLKCVNHTSDSLMLCWESKGKLTKDTCLLFLPTFPPKNYLLNGFHIKSISIYYITSLILLVVNGTCCWHTVYLVLTFWFLWVVFYHSSSHTLYMRVIGQNQQ